MVSYGGKPQVADRVRILRTPGYDGDGIRWTHLDGREAVVLKVGGFSAPNFGDAGPAVKVRYRIGDFGPSTIWLPAVVLDIIDRPIP